MTERSRRRHRTSSAWTLGVFVAISVVFHVALCTLFNAWETSPKATATPPPGTSHDVNPTRANKAVAATASYVLGFMFLILSTKVIV